MSVKKAKKPPRSNRLKNSVRAGNFMRSAWGTGPQVIVLAVICVMTAAVLIAARQPSRRVDIANADAQNAPPDKVAMAARLETKKAAVSRAPATAATAKTYTADGSMENAPAVESTPQTDVQILAPVTITGCLELDEETFWLKDASGADAPRSRSWRSGFLKKRSSPIELVDATNALTLPNYVGQRVAATGMLVNREMRAHSLQRIAVSCS